MSSYDPGRFAEARKLFPHTDSVTYFNSASFCPFATPVADAIKNNVDLRLAADQDDTRLTHETLEALPRKFAELIGGRPEDIGLGGNTSFGLNVAAFALPLKSGDEILISDIEFPSALYTFKGAAIERGVKPKLVKSHNREFDIDEFQKAVTKRSRALVISSVQFFNGYQNDLKTLGEICRANDMYFVVDGIQGLGIEPINVSELGIDIFTSGCQKWMLAPQGTGVYYVAEKLQDELGQPWATWHEVDWQMDFSDLFKYELSYHEDARRWQMGYYSVLNLLGLDAAVDVILGLGVSNIQQHNRGLLDRLASYLEENPAFTITSNMQPKHRSSILTFTCDGFERLHKELLKHKIVCVHREGSIRVSAHLFNDESDIDRLIAILDAFAD
ncbi:aminotransferase class V-fold PLP-dependent enzyme [candidate division GN15 bacterium]|nr:aminotransferase class V-fold PLP-dependent enzyme [candidate division GN15 bacterium]